MDVKPLFHSVQAAEKVYTDFTLTATNPGGHSSVPRPDNAIYQLADALARLPKFTFPGRAQSDDARASSSRRRRSRSRRSRRRCARSSPIPATPRPRPSLSRDPRYASMLRTTCVATRLAGGHAYNALPQSATANVNCRMVPTSSSAEVRATLARVIADTGIKITFTQPAEPRVPEIDVADRPGAARGDDRDHEVRCWATFR